MRDFVARLAFTFAGPRNIDCFNCKTQTSKYFTWAQDFQVPWHWDFIQIDTSKLSAPKNRKCEWANDKKTRPWDPWNSTKILWDPGFWRICIKNPWFKSPWVKKDHWFASPLVQSCVALGAGLMLSFQEDSRVWPHYLKFAAKNSSQ